MTHEQVFNIIAPLLFSNLNCDCEFHHHRNPHHHDLCHCDPYQCNLVPLWLLPPCHHDSCHCDLYHYDLCHLATTIYVLIFLQCLLCLFTWYCLPTQLRFKCLSFIPNAQYLWSQVAFFWKTTLRWEKIENEKTRYIHPYITVFSFFLFLFYPYLVSQTNLHP